MVSVVRAKVLAVAHACEEPSAAEPRKTPAVVLSQNETWLNVSEVPPLVQPPDMEAMDLEPAAAAFQVTDLRVVSPAAAAVVPAEPGSAVWSLTANTVGAVNAVPANMSSHLLARLAFERPTVTTVPLAALLALHGFVVLVLQ